MNVHFSSKTNEWTTPQSFFNELNKEFKFTLDPCATEENTKCHKYFTTKENGLSKSWDNENVFCNPPYGREIKNWVKKAGEARGGVCGSINSCTDRYSILSSIHLQESGNSFFERSIKIWRFKEFCSISKYVSYI